MQRDRCERLVSSGPLRRGTALPVVRMLRLRRIISALSIPTSPDYLTGTDLTPARRWVHFGERLCRGAPGKRATRNDNKHPRFAMLCPVSTPLFVGYCDPVQVVGDDAQILDILDIPHGVLVARPHDRLRIENREFVEAHDVPAKHIQ